MAEKVPTEETNKNDDKKEEKPVLKDQIQALNKKLRTLRLEQTQGKDQQQYKFWDTQPVPKLEVAVTSENTEINADLTPDQVRKIPLTIQDSFTWCELDLSNDQHLNELFDLLSENYVEDMESTFRFEYSREIIRWALMPPGYKKVWHAAIRVKGNGKLVSFIAATPATLQIFEKQKESVEINFLCIHKKLRSKRLAPVLIKEITRRVHLEGLFQAVYTAGVFLPKPITTAPYYHRTLNSKKLIDIGFTYMKPNMTLARTIKLNRLPEKTQIPGLRKIAKNDMDETFQIYVDYMTQFDFYQKFNRAEFEHYMTPIDKHLYTFVVEDPETHKITAFASFYVIHNRILLNANYTDMTACYLWYYAAPSDDFLRKLVNDMLIIAKNEGYDVFNCMKILRNQYFVDDLKFGVGDGSLNFYLYNWRCPSVECDKQGFIVI